MSNYDQDLSASRAAGGYDVVVDLGLRQYMLRIYNYMASGVGLTALVAWLTYLLTDPALLQSPLMWVFILAPLALVFFIGARINSLSATTARWLFFGYAALMGVSLSTLLHIYTSSSITRVFFVAAATFGMLSLYGYSTKRDLSGFGTFLFMGLIGVIIATVINLFLQSSGLDWLISIVGVGVFAGLTAYDTQRIKAMHDSRDDETTSGRKAVIAALSLYLNFINLFMMMLRLSGTRR
jgi:FtsH-binding integral membrane protein